MIEIRASRSGFHFLSPLGDPLAPDVFLNAAPFPRGDITLPDSGTAWQSDGTLDWPAGRILLDASAALDPRADSATDTIRIDTIRYLRPGDGGAVEVGRIDLDTPLVVEVTHDPGDGTLPAWHGAAAAALAARLSAEGYRFLGSAGADHFAPARDVLPVHGPVEILGRGGDDVLSGARNDDTIRGGSGDDRITDAGGADAIWGGTGRDDISLGAWSTGSTARGGAGADILRSSNGADRLIGNAGDDRLAGGRGADRLMGNAGDDRLDGGDGDDRLVGGPGDDLMTGGDGADLFVFRAGQPGHDIITDFDPAADTLRLRGLADPAMLEIHQDGLDTVITWGDPEASLTLQYTDAAHLDGADILLF